MVLVCGKCQSCRYCVICCEQSRILYLHLLRAYKISCRFDAAQSTSRRKQIQLDLLHARLLNLWNCSKIRSTSSPPPGRFVVPNEQFPRVIDLYSYLIEYPIVEDQPSHSVDFYLPKIEEEKKKYGCPTCMCEYCNTCCHAGWSQFKSLSVFYEERPSKEIYDQLQRLTYGHGDRKLPQIRH